MAAVTSAIIGAAGLGVAGYGAYKSNQATKKANQQTSKANAEQKKLAKVQQEASDASVRAEALREQQMELEGIRRRRDVIRQAQGARALGIARSNAAGAMGSSGQVGGQQQVASQERMDVLANLQNIMLGRGIFEENRNIYAAQAKGSSIQTQVNQYASAASQYGAQANYYQSVFGAGLNLAQSGPTFSNVYTTMTQGARDVFAPSTSGWQTTVTPLK